MWFEMRTKKGCLSLKSWHSPLLKSHSSPARLQRAPPTTRGLCEALATSHARRAFSWALKRVCVRGAWPGLAAPRHDSHPGTCRSLHFLSPASAFTQSGRSPTFISPLLTARPGILSPPCSAKGPCVWASAPWRYRRCRARGWPSARSCLTSPRSWAWLSPTAPGCTARRGPVHTRRWARPGASPM